MYSCAHLSMRSRRRFRQGFSLIEIMVATIILGVALLGVLMLFSRGTAMANQGYEFITVDAILQDQIEHLRGLPVSMIISMYYPSAAFTPTPSAFARLNSPQGTITVSYPLGSTAPNNSLVEVTVRVNWVSAGNRPLVKETATYIMEQGINRL